MVPAHITLVFATSMVGLADLSALCARVAHETSTIAIELAPPVTMLDVIESVKRIEFPVSDHANEIFALHMNILKEDALFLNKETQIYTNAQKDEDSDKYVDDL